jgi:hypothetical protein
MVGYRTKHTMSVTYVSQPPHELNGRIGCRIGGRIGKTCTLEGEICRL